MTNSGYVSFGQTFRHVGLPVVVTVVESGVVSEDDRLQSVDDVGESGDQAAWLHLTLHQMLVVYFTSQRFHLGTKWFPVMVLVDDKVVCDGVDRLKKAAALDEDGS